MSIVKFDFFLRKISFFFFFFLFHVFGLKANEFQIKKNRKTAFSRFPLKKIKPKDVRKHCTHVRYSATIPTLSIVNRFWIKVMLRQPFPCNLFPLGIWHSIIAVWINGDTTSWQKLSPYFNIAWVHQGN